MAPVFEEFVTEVIMKGRGVGGDSDFEYDAVSELLFIYLIMWLSCDHQVTIEANGLSIKCPYQLLINGEFVNSSRTQTYDTINPANEEVCGQI